MKSQVEQEFVHGCIHTLQKQHLNTQAFAGCMAGQCTSLLQVGKVLKDISVQHVSLYWQVQQHLSSDPGSGSLSDSNWQHVDHPAEVVPLAAHQPEDSATSKPATSHIISGSHADLPSFDALGLVAQPDSHPASATASDRGTPAPGAALKAADAQSTAQASDSDRPPDALLLSPMSCVVRVASLTDKRTGITRLNTLVAVDTLNLQVTQLQLCDMLRLADLFAVWQLHNRYALLRPTGWRSDPDHAKIPARSDCHVADALLAVWLTIRPPWSKSLHCPTCVSHLDTWHCVTSMKPPLLTTCTQL